MLKNVGLFFGTFDPVHNGHMMIALRTLETFERLDKIWFVVSPHNPQKNINHITHFNNRCEMVQIACNKLNKIVGEDKFILSKVEEKLSKSSFTSKTLKYLKKEYPDANFKIIMGEDCINNLHTWKDYKYILKNFEVIVYPRKTDNKKRYKRKTIGFISKINCPLFEISSTNIRERVREGKKLDFLVPNKIYKYIKKKNLYI